MRRSTLVPLPASPISGPLNLRTRNTNLLKLRIRNTDTCLVSDLSRPPIKSVIAGNENFPSVLL